MVFRGEKKRTLRFIWERKKAFTCLIWFNVMLIHYLHISDTIYSAWFMVISIDPFTNCECVAKRKSTTFNSILHSYFRQMLNKNGTITYTYNKWNKQRKTKQFHIHDNNLHSVSISLSFLVCADEAKKHLSLSLSRSIAIAVKLIGRRYSSSSSSSSPA